MYSIESQLSIDSLTHSRPQTPDTLDGSNSRSLLYVTKRDGTTEQVIFDKITKRIQRLCFGLDTIDPASIAQQIVARIYPGVTTAELDGYSAQLCASKGTDSLEYGTLASRIVVSNLHKTTSTSFVDTMLKIMRETDGRIFRQDIVPFVERNRESLDAMIVHTRDYDFDFFGMKTLLRSYLHKLNGHTVERPQYMWMRVALEMFAPNLSTPYEDCDSLALADIKTAYTDLSMRRYTHATPTLFNSCTRDNQLASCFLVAMKDDSLVGIYDTLKDCAMISKCAGGIGIHISNIRAKGSTIHSTGGKSDGILPMLKVFNSTSKYVTQGGRRAGSIAVYIEPWHADIADFLDLKRNTGAEELRARDLFYALWIPDLFMRRVRDDAEWTLFCPTLAPGLADVYGEAFDELYERYEREGRGGKTVRAQDIWRRMVTSQIETGMPYVMYKCAVNRASNQKNIGPIKSSNLCTEIMEYSSPDESAVCNLASIALPAFLLPPRLPKTAPVVLNRTPSTVFKRDDTILIKAYCRKHNIKFQIETFDTDGDYKPEIIAKCADCCFHSFHEFRKWAPVTFDFDEFRRSVGQIVVNLNQVIDRTHYPIPECRNSNMRHRPIGIGIQGLATLFMRLRIAFDSDEARTLNARIFEHLYYAAIDQSCTLAEKNGPYSTFEGSPASKGLLQFDLWTSVPHPCAKPTLDFDTLKQRVQKHGLRNSLLVAPMPTASTAQILGNSECFEPIQSNIFSRRTLAGEFPVVNKELVEDLTVLKRWNTTTKNKILANDGSVATLEELPDHLKSVYKTAWEISMRAVIDLSIDRGRFICQGQSLNLYMATPNYNKVSAMLFHSWKHGAKNGLYYLRSRGKATAQQFTVTPTTQTTPKPKLEEQSDVCAVCSA